MRDGGLGNGQANKGAVVGRADAAWLRLMMLVAT